MATTAEIIPSHFFNDLQDDLKDLLRTCHESLKQTIRQTIWHLKTCQDGPIDRKTEDGRAEAAYFLFLQFALICYRAQGKDGTEIEKHKNELEVCCKAIGLLGIQREEQWLKDVLNPLKTLRSCRDYPLTLIPSYCLAFQRKRVHGTAYRGAGNHGTIQYTLGRGKNDVESADLHETIWKSLRRLLMEIHDNFDTTSNNLFILVNNLGPKFVNGENIELAEEMLLITVRCAFICLREGYLAKEHPEKDRRGFANEKSIFLEVLEYLNHRFNE